MIFAICIGILCFPFVALAGMIIIEWSSWVDRRREAKAAEKRRRKAGR